jgi:hypothetical protein
MDEFTIKIDTTNSAFSDPDPATELARILREVAKRVEAGETTGYVKDGNGNKVGRFNATETVGDPAPHRKAARPDEQSRHEDEINLRSTRHGMN